MNHGRSSPGRGALPPASTQARNTLVKGEMAIIAAGVEGMSVSQQLINTVREDVLNKKNNITTPQAAHTHALSKLPPDGMHYQLLKRLNIALEPEFRVASRGECISAMDLDHAVATVIKESLPPNVLQSGYLAKVTDVLLAIPDRYHIDNMNTMQLVKERGVVLPPHAQLGMQLDSSLDDSSPPEAIITQLAKERRDQKQHLEAYIVNQDAHLLSLREETQKKRVALCEVEQKAYDAGAKVGQQKEKVDQLTTAANLAQQAAAAAANPAGGADGGGSGDGNDSSGSNSASAAQQQQQTAAAAAAANAALTAATAELQQLEQGLAALKQEVKAAAEGVKQAEQAAATAEDTKREGVARKLGTLTKLSKDLEELKRSLAGNVGSPIKLEDIMYVGAEGAEQAIFLPVLKELTILRCLLCVPTPAQIKAIMTRTKQGESLFPQEGVQATEDIQQFGTRVKNYVLAAQLVGQPVDGPTLVLLGLRNQDINRRVTGALDAHTGAVTIDDVVRKAVDVQAKLQSTQMLADMRGLYGGKSAMVAGGVDDRGYEADNGSSGSSGAAILLQKLDKLAVLLSSVDLTQRAGAAAAGFKQAGRFATGTAAGSSSGGSSGGPAAAGGSSGDKKPAAGSSGDRQQRPKCPECGRRHPGECWGKHEACGRYHHPDKECYGPGAAGGRRYGGRSTRGGAAAGGGNAAAAAGVLSDEELAAAAAEALGVWGHEGGCNVAVLLEAGSWEDEDYCQDDELDGAALASGSLRQALPASFHQVKHGMTTRRTARLAEAQLQQEGEAEASGENTAGGTPAAAEASEQQQGGGREADFKELQLITPAGGHVMIVMDPLADSKLLQGLLGSGADTALAVLRMPSITFRQLLERGSMSLLPATTVAASPAALSAALASDSPSSRLSSVPEGQVLGPQAAAVGSSSTSDLQPLLPYLKPGSFRFYDTVGKKQATSIQRLLLDTGASGALVTVRSTDQDGLSWRRLRGASVATANGSEARPEGVTQGVKLLMLPGTPQATAVAFDALVMDTGRCGIYDAILGREQMHLLGMVMDFGRQTCYIRPKLRSGVWDLVPVPWTCVKEGRRHNPEELTKMAGVCAELLEAGVLEEVPTSEPPSFSWENDFLALNELVVRDRFPCCVLEEPAGVLDFSILSESQGTELGGSVGVEHAAAAAELQAQEKAWSRGWEGEQEARLMAAGDVEPNPGPHLRAPTSYPSKGPWLVALLCMLAVCIAGTAAVAQAAGRLLYWAASTLAAGWFAAVVCVPKLSTWANLRLEVAKAPRARRPKKRLSWQLLAALTALPPRCIKQHRFRSRAAWALLLLGLALSCGTVTATVGLMEQTAPGILNVGTVGATETGMAPTYAAHPGPVELLAGELMAPFTPAYKPGVPFPTELLEALEPAGERDKPSSAPDVTVDPDGKWQFASHPEASSEEKEQLKEAVKSRKHAFAYSHAEMPGYEHKVGWKLKHKEPIKEPCHGRKFSPAEKAILDEKCAELEEAGLIEEIPSTNKYACHPVLAAKKDGVTGEWTQKRLCQNYRKLNAAMVPDGYTPPLPEDIFATAAGCKVWSVIDMRAGFHQLVLDEETANTTAFWWNRRLMKYNRLSFGTRNATAIYQRVMDEVLRQGGCSDFAIAYVDDLVIFSKDMASHIEHVKKVLDAIHKVGLRAHPEKSIFGASEVEYLGHMVSADGLSPTKAKVAAILDLPSPRNLSELRCIMGILNYYRLYIPGFSQLAAPVYELTRNNVSWDWTTEREAAYQKLKQALATPGLALRPPDPNREFVLHTDWSVSGIGAVLGQVDDQGSEYMVACASRSLNEHEKRYTPWKGELLAAVWGMKTFRHYLHGRNFRLVTDHRPLLGLLTTAEPNSQQVRWLMAVQDHDFVVQHRAGVKHTNADALSRFPQATTLDTAGARMDQGPLPAPTLPEIIMPDGRRLTGEEAAQEMGDNWQEEMLAQHMTSAAAVAVLSEAVLDVYGPPVPSWMDDFAPPACELVGYAAAAPNLTDIQSWPQHQERLLQSQASEWVSAAQQHMANSRNHTAGGGVDTGCCAATFFPAARRQGVTLFEPFGGLGAGLEMVLRHGIRVNRYLYADTSAAAQQIMKHRLAQLTTRYPDLLTPAAWEKALDVLPMDVYEITKANLTAVVQPGEQWLVVAGWECQDLSPAGGGKGLRGSKSNSYYQLLHLLNGLQGATREKGNPPIGYLLENTAFQYHWSAEVAGRDFAAVCDVLGTPLEVDAARFGSRAHRLRNFWTNLGEPSKIAAAITCAERPPGLTVQQILEHGRSPMPVVFASRAPWYPCNKVGQPREALPTLMAYEGSYSFKPRRSGSIWDENTQEYTEPTAKERELALGYASADTAAPDVTELERRQVLGRCMDANTTQALFGICEAWHDVSAREAESKGVYPEHPAVAVAAAVGATPGQDDHLSGLAGAFAVGSEAATGRDVQSAQVAEAFSSG